MQNLEEAAKYYKLETEIREEWLEQNKGTMLEKMAQKDLIYIWDNVTRLYEKLGKTLGDFFIEMNQYKRAYTWFATNIENQEKRIKQEDTFENNLQLQLLFNGASDIYTKQGKDFDAHQMLKTAISVCEATVEKFPKNYSKELLSSYYKAIEVCRKMGVHKLVINY